MIYSVDKEGVSDKVPRFLARTDLLWQLYINVSRTGQFNEHIRLFETLYRGKLKGIIVIHGYIHVYTCIYITNMLYKVIYELSFGTMTFDLYQMASWNHL